MLSQLVGHAGSTTRSVHADMTLTRSKVKVTGSLNFKNYQSRACILAAMTVIPLPGLSGCFTH